jgi:DNA-binding transcriptional regulator PaaX
MLDKEQRTAVWRLLIYTVPSEPSRKRAFVWRELKKVGAVYLRDGVCVLPDREATAATMNSIAAKIEEFGGDAIVVGGVTLEASRADRIVESSNAARQQEYADISQEADNLLKHVQRETQHREFTFAELEELEADLKKLRGWFEQIQARDYFGASSASAAAALLERCDQAVGAFMEAASDQESRW